MLERCSNTLMLDIVKTFYPNVDGLAKRVGDDFTIKFKWRPNFCQETLHSLCLFSFFLSLSNIQKTFSLTKLEGIGVYILNKLISKIFLSNVGSKFFDISVYYYPLCESILT